MDGGIVTLKQCFGYILQKKSRWHTFSASLLAASVAGTSYAFGIFSQALKNKLDFSQADLSIISSCGSTGLYTQVFVGFLIELYGPSVVLVLGATLICCNNLYIWLAVQHHVYNEVAAIAVVWLLAQVGIACASSVCIVVALRVFPDSVRGRIAGLAKAYFGISSAILASIASGFFGESSVDFILFVAIALPCVFLFASMNVNFMPDRLVSFRYELSRDLSTSLYPYMYHLLALIMSILVIGATSYTVDLSRIVKMLLGSVVALLVFFVLTLPRLFYHTHTHSESGTTGKDKVNNGEEESCATNSLLIAESSNYSSSSSSSSSRRNSREYSADDSPLLVNSTAAASATNSVDNEIVIYQSQTILLPYSLLPIS